MIRLTQYNGKSIGVFGLGTAGKAAITALSQGGASVYAWDDNVASRDALAEDAGFARLGNAVLQPPEEWPWARLARLVLSPGVPLTHPQPHPVVELAEQHGVIVCGEVDMLYQACPDARYIGITGTNGKSTTTALLGHILKQNGLRAEVGANLGVPALALPPLDKDGIYVLEMSSYQLDLTRDTLFNVATLLNITPDHLDRHGGMRGYVAAKQRIFARQRAQDVACIGLDDAYCLSVYDAVSMDAAPRCIGLSVEGAEQATLTVDDEGVLRDAAFVAEGESPFTAALAGLPRLQGQHNWQNIAAAYAMARSVGLEPQRIMEAVQSFAGLPHRLEWVAEKQGVTFLNDSKATNAEAAARALEPFARIHWILGGRAKAGGIAGLERYFPRIAHAYLIGEAEDAFADTLEGRVPYTRCGDLQHATRAAVEAALADDVPSVVLLSPACASFDQWRSFEARGDAFRQYVKTLIGEGDHAA